MHQNSPFWASKSKNFLWRAHGTAPPQMPPNGEEDTRSPHLTPLPSRRLGLIVIVQFKIFLILRPALSRPWYFQVGCYHECLVNDFVFQRPTYGFQAVKVWDLGRGSAVPPPKKIFRFWSSKWRVLVHSGRSNFLRTRVPVFFACKTGSWTVNKSAQNAPKPFILSFKIEKFSGEGA